jgi:hypothetical protein
MLLCEYFILLGIGSYIKLTKRRLCGGWQIRTPGFWVVGNITVNEEGKI